jgi:ribose transport system ATP-binding protein
MLRMSDIDKSFAGVQVLSRISLTLGPGEILGLVGENGAGKSTLMNVLGGVLKMDSGTMVLGGQDYAPASPKAAAEAGVAFIHQELNLFSNLTVAENMFLDAFPTGLAGRIRFGQIKRAAAEYLTKYEVPAQADTRIEALPMGARQMVEIAKALMNAARIIIFDEPTTSLSQREKEKLFKTILGLKAQGISIIYISHILEDVLRLCDRITVIRDGHVIGTLERAEAVQPQLVRMMVGREITQAYPASDRRAQEVLLEAREVRRAPLVKGVSLSVRAGEIVGLYGLMGAGRTELLRTLFGVDPMDSGELWLRGARIPRPTPEICIREGMAFVTEDRRQEGLLMPKPVRDNLILVRLRSILKRLGVIDRARENGLTRSIIADLHVKVAESARQPVASLSGGNQQKVVIGKWMLNGPRVFLLDEPTRGVDVGAKFEIYSIVSQMAEKGSAILMVSSEMEELMGICDRVLVMKNGTLAGEVPRAAFRPEAIGSLAL